MFATMKLAMKCNRAVVGSLSSPCCRSRSPVIRVMGFWCNLWLWSTRAFLYDWWRLMRRCALEPAFAVLNRYLPHVPASLPRCKVIHSRRVTSNCLLLQYWQQCRLQAEVLEECLCSACVEPQHWQGEPQTKWKHNPKTVHGTFVLENVLPGWSHKKKRKGGKHRRRL